MKLASLFDGIGGFPLAATMLGIEPVWASEIEKFPIAVTKERFPNMKHLGSVCDIKGAEVEPVDIITFGSPCQDLSVAGKRAGMGEGTRSGLFSEAVRIIREMRSVSRIRDTNDVGSECGKGVDAATTSAGPQHGIRSNNGGKDGRYPRFAVWENVPGAYSSNGGEDFRAVVESLAKVVEEAVSIPLPKDGKWEPAGLVEGDGWSIAWRTLDAQFWGVPQRRKRIFLVADFGGDRASEIFFEREGVSWNPAKSGSSGQEATGGVEGGVRATGFGRTTQLKNWIEYEQFTRWDQEHHPKIDNDEYLNYKDIGGTLCSYGYRRCYDVGNGVIKYEWVKREEALKELGGLKERVAGFKGGQGAKAHGIGYAEEQSPTLGAEAKTPTICLHATQDPITAENRSHALGANSSQAVYRFQRTDAFVEDSKCSPLAARDCKDGRDLVITKENENASEIKTNAREILFKLRQEIGEEAFAKWRFGILDSLQQKEILQSKVHGSSIPKEAEEVISAVYDRSLSCQKHNTSGELPRMPETECTGCSSQGRELAEQCARELGTDMSELPQSQTQAEKLLFDMSETSEGIRILREALSEIQEIWQSFNIKSQTVRRLTPREAERLQGFSDNWTNIPGASDAARYKALGNSVAIPCVYFILSCLRREL